MNEELIKEKLKSHDERLNNYGCRIDKIEQDNASLKTEVKNLGNNLQSLTGVMKWFIGIWVVTLLGFFIYSIEKLI